MPSAVTHYIFCRDLADSIPVEIHREAFILGGFGPDFLLFHRAAPWQFGTRLNKISTGLHRGNPAAALTIMADFLVNSPNFQLIQSYILGYLAHYALDRTAHPYIYWAEKTIISGEKIKYHPFFVHTRIENNLDQIVMQNLESPPKFANQGELIPDNREVLEGAAALMFCVIEGLFPGRSDVESILQAFGDFKKNLGLLGRAGLIPAILKGIQGVSPNKIPDIEGMFYPKKPDSRFDYGNFSRMNWQNPLNPADSSDLKISRNDTFIELFQSAKDEAKALFAGFLGGYDLQGLTGGINFRGINSILES